MTDGDTRVSYREADDKWAVEVEGAAWAGSRHDRKVRAERVARSVAQEKRADMLVQDKTGQIEKRKTYKRGSRG